VAKRKRRWAVQAGPSSDELEPGTAAFVAQLHGEDTFAWPAEPTDRARFWGITDDPYVVDVEFARLAPDGELVPVGVAVRRTFPVKRKKKGKNYSFVEGTELAPVSAVDLRGIPFGRVIRAATAAVRRAEPMDERHDELARILVPPGRPKRGRSIKFYCDILKAAHEFEQRNLSPAKEIARRKKVSENLVYQWLHVAREHARLGRCNG
jgi:hypothetical protein